MSEHPVVTNPTPGSVDAPESTGTDVKAVRAWAFENVDGFTATRGRISAEVQEAYDKAHQA